jgi:hypothetical protein
VHTVSGNFFFGNDQTALAHPWNLDETGTINIASFDNLSDEEVQQTEIREITMLDINEEILKVHGHLPLKKGKRIINLIYENAIGFNNHLSFNNKVENMII